VFLSVLILVLWTNTLLYRKVH